MYPNTITNTIAGNIIAIPLYLGIASPLLGKFYEKIGEN